MSTPSPSTPQQLKKTLVASGFEVFRTLAEEVVLAERVRENLILDSGVRVGPLPDGRLRVRIVVRAQRTDFPNDDEAALFARCRDLAKSALAEGFAEDATHVNAITDPVDPERTLDTFYELFLKREVGGVDEAVAVIRYALSLEKAVHGANSER